MKKENKTAKHSSVKIISLIAITAVIFINLCLCFIPASFRTVDITSNKAYTLSDEATEILNSLDEELTVYVIGANGLDTRYEYLLEKIDSLEKVKVEWTKFENIADKAEALGLEEDTAGPYCVIVESARRSIFYDYYNLIRLANKNTALVTYIQALSSSTGIPYASVSNGTAEMTLSQYQQVGSQIYSDMSNGGEYAVAYQSILASLLDDSELYFYGENMLCRAAEYVTVDVIPARYYLTGHNEADLKKSVLGGLMFPQMGLDYKELNISTDENIPEDAVDIIIASPKTDISAAEAAKLSKYVEGGGMLTLFTDGDCVNMPNLMGLMGEYGMTLQAGVITERMEKKEADTEGDSKVEAQSDVIGPAPESSKYEYTDKISVGLNTTHKGLMALSGNTQISPVVVKGNEIIYQSDEKKGIKVTPLLTTSSNCFVGDNEDELAPRALAVVSEKENSGRLLWYTGASSFIGAVTEDMTDEEQSRAVSNGMVVASTSGLAPFTYETTITPPAGKLHAEKYMTVTDTAYLWTVLLPVIIVIIVSIIGVILIYRRKKA